MARIRFLLLSLSAVLLSVTPLSAQRECGSLQNIINLNAADSTGVVHQNVCWDPIAKSLSFPLSPVGGTGLTGMTAGQIPKAASATTVTSSIPLQGTDTSILTSGTITGTSVLLCTDANGGATTSSCPSGGGGLSGMTAGQIPKAATATTVTSSIPIQGADSSILSSGTVSGTSALLCTDAAGGATTTACPAGNGLSGMTAGQLAKAATATTVTSSVAIQGTDTSVLSAGTISGTSVLLCTDANGGATTSSCPAGGGTISGQTVGQLPLPGSATTITNTIAAGTNQGFYNYNRQNTVQGTPVTPVESQVGDCSTSGTISGATNTYIVLYTDVIGCTVVHDRAASAANTVTLPTPTTLNNTHPILVYRNDSAQTDTVTPTTFTISQGNAAAAASLSVPSNVSCKINVDPVNASTWKADCHPNATSGSAPTAGSGISVAGSTVSWNPDDPTMVALRVDLCGNFSFNPNNVGQTLFETTLTGAATFQISTATTWPEFCDTIMTSTATNPSGVLLTAGDTPTVGRWIIPPLNANAGWDFRMRFALSSTATQKLYVGVGNLPTAAAPGTNWIGIRYDTSVADTTFVFESSNSGTPSTLAFSSVSTGHHTLRVRSPVAGQINMSLDGSATEYCFTTSGVSPGCAGGNVTSANFPSTVMDPFFLWENLSTTAGVTANAEFFYMQATGLAR